MDYSFLGFYIFHVLNMIDETVVSNSASLTLIPGRCRVTV